MKKLDTRIIWGTLLVLGGILLLLNNLIGLLDRLPFNLWGILMGLAGLIFVGVFVTSRANWWAAIPGFTLLGISLLIGLERLFPRFADIWGGSLVTGGIATGFLLIYITQREQWWALIPGGTLLTVTFMIGLGGAIGEAAIPAVFFMGLGATFSLLYLLPPPGQERLTWAIYPALSTLALGLLILALLTPLAGFLWPAVLIILGIYLLLHRNHE